MTATVDRALQDMVEILNTYGDRYSGGDAAEVAQDWADNDFTADTMVDWLDAGFWDAGTAAEVRDAGISAEAAKETAERLAEADDASETYTDGDPIYSCCNGDTSVDVLIS